MLDLTQVVTAILGIGLTALGTWITTKVIPWLKARTSKAQWDFWEGVAATTVSAAEQIFEEKQGAEKFRYVADALQARGIVLDTSTVQALIEQAVRDMWVREAYAVSGRRETEGEAG